MGKVVATATAQIPASPETVLSLLGDLGRRSEILTENYTSVEAESPDVIAFHFAAGGRERDYRLTSARSGSEITETDALSSFVNTWSVSADGAGSQVSLTAAWDGAGGIGGFFEKRFASLGLKSIYTQVLANLGAAVTS